MREGSPKQWQSLAELEGPEGTWKAGLDELLPASALAPDAREGISRRRALGLLGATAALAAGTATACSKADRGPIVPYTKKPEEIVPGVANYYATTFPEGLNAYGVLVKTREGRPIHVSGNDEHPLSKGKTSLRAIADVLRLYDPERLAHPLVDGKTASWDEALRRVVAGIEPAKGVLLLTGAAISPTTRALIGDLRKVLSGLKHWECEPAVSATEAAALQACFGGAVRPRLNLDGAEVIVSFEADFLNGEDTEAVRAFARKRRPVRPTEPMNRLWAFEGRLTLTGARADHRFPVRPSQTGLVAFALARLLNEQHALTLPAGLPPEALSKLDVAQVASAAGVPESALAAVASDLARAGKAAVVIPGPALPAEAHAACHLLNAMLGAEGLRVDPAHASGDSGPQSSGDLRTVTAWLASGECSVALLWGPNVSYAHPDPTGWKSALAKVPLKVRLGLFEDETAKDCQVLLPENHWLESWGDYEPSTDLLSLQQPVVAPLYDTRQGEEVLLAILRTLGGAAAGDYLAYLKARWQREVYPAGSAVPFEEYWAAALHDGVVERAAGPRPPRPAQNGGALSEALTRAASELGREAPGAFELILHADPKVYDGRYAGNGWLQELPHPITRMTWGNPLGISVQDASRLGVRDGDVLKLTAGGVSIEAPVLAQPGQAQGVLTLALGYGRTAGAVASGVGVNAFPLLSASGGGFLVPQVQAVRTGRSAKLPRAQMYTRMGGRDIARSWTVEEYARRAGHQEKRPNLTTLYPPQRFPEHKWGMAIDLSTCVGCGACVVACQSENNVAVVGPEQVLRGRAMHWIRVDLYYEGPPESPKTIHQPMLCQQCDDAPCETVCPVNATNHSPDGLNQMVYNRCVGTRYCANNCPYKVRRFNFLEWTAFTEDPKTLVFNPEVTVRPRGVMEKCTFCVQRIHDARMRAKAEKRSIRDGEIVPACAAACPAEAIVFGNLKDPESIVSKLSARDRGYKVLEELGVRPSVTYLADLRNPFREKGRI